jgi:hypothetical protein
MSEPESLGYSSSSREAVYRVHLSKCAIISRDNTLPRENLLFYKAHFLWIHFYPIINRVSTQLTYHFLTPLDEAHRYSSTSRRSLHQICHTNHTELHTRQTHSNYYRIHESIPGRPQFILFKIRGKGMRSVCETMCVVMVICTVTGSSSESIHG